MRGRATRDFVVALGDSRTIVFVDAVGEGTAGIGGVTDPLEVLHSPGTSDTALFYAFNRLGEGAGRKGEDSGDDADELHSVSSWLSRVWVLYERCSSDEMELEVDDKERAFWGRDLKPFMLYRSSLYRPASHRHPQQFYRSLVMSLFRLL